MFESDEKKYLKKKYSNLGTTTSKSLKPKDFDNSKPNTVYSELKLSEQLNT